MGGGGGGGGVGVGGGVGLVGEGGVVSASGGLECLPLPSRMACVHGPTGAGSGVMGGGLVPGPGSISVGGGGKVECVPICGFTRADPPSFFGSVPPSAGGCAILPTVTPPSAAPAKGLPFLEVPSVESCRDAWLDTLAWLEGLPNADLALVSEVRAYVSDGVRLRFQDVPPPPRHYSNTYSFNQNEEVGRQRLREYEELGALKWLSDPPPPGGYPYVQPLHAILKDGKKARICVDLSRNLNDFLVDEYFSFSSVRSAVRLAQQAVDAGDGGGCFFVKLDISSCFLSFPLHPEDLKYYVCKVGGDYLQFLRMVFGLKSAPRTASLLLDVVSAAMEDAGIAHERYLDDFWLVATTESRAWVCAHRAAMLLSRFGLALSPAKVEGPARVLEYLGIVVDSVNRTLSISSARQAELMGLLSDFSTKRWCSLRGIQSLIGKLSFAAAVLPGARPFMRRMIDSTRSARRRVCLGHLLQADVVYWKNI